MTKKCEGCSFADKEDWDRILSVLKLTTKLDCVLQYGIWRSAQIIQTSLFPTHHEG